MAYKVPAVSTMSRPEWIADIPWSPDTILMLPTQGSNIPNDRYLYALLLQFEGRFTQPSSGNATGTQADGPISIIDSVIVQGFSRTRGSNEQFINVRAADLYEETLEKTGRAPYISGVLNTGASATSDIRFLLPIIFPPMGIAPAQQMGYVLDAPNYDRLQLQILAADVASIFTGQTGVISTSAYGSSTGTARIRVSGIFIQAGASQFQGFMPGRVWRYFHENTSSQLTSTSTQVALENVSVGNYLRSIMCKTGIKSTSVTAGFNAYNSLSDTILQNIKLTRGINKQIQFLADFFSLKEATGQYYKITPSKGYGLIDWAPRGTLATTFNTVNLVAGPTGDTSVQVVSDVIGASNQAALFQYEELRGLPVSQ